ncbi:MAG: DUF3352 domain-containing protein [Marmoricola sp.]
MTEHTAALPEQEPEPQARRSRGLIAVIASVLAVVLIAGGGFAAWQFFASGPRPAEVLPDSTFALATVDLDPSGGQKVEAIKTLRKFPSWRERTGITPESDVVKEIFDEALKDGPCKALDYERDVKSWIGSRAGFGGVLLGDDKPAPVLVLQVTDADNARSGFARLAKCANGEDDEFGWTIADDYVVASDSTSHAEAIVAAGKKSPLSENADFQKWTEEAGGPGIVNLYVGRKSAEVASDAFRSELGPLSGDPGASPGESPEDELAEAFEDFKGAAAVLKFNDGGIDLSFASSGAKAEKGRTVGEHVAALPKDTAAVMAMAVPEKAIEALRESDAVTDDSPFSLRDLVGESTGLDLPDDLITLLGQSLSISVGGDAPADLKAIASPADVPLGVLIHGDTDKIEAVIAKAEAKAGVKLSELPATVSSGDGKVSIATTPDYAEALRAKGSLGEVKSFKDVVSHADEAQAVFYVSFENAWMDGVRELAAEEKDPEAAEVADNLAVLRALGASAWNEGSTSHGLLRLALK